MTNCRATHFERRCVHFPGSTRGLLRRDKNERKERDLRSLSPFYHFCLVVRDLCYQGIYGPKYLIFSGISSKNNVKYGSTLSFQQLLHKFSFQQELMLLLCRYFMITDNAFSLFVCFTLFGQNRQPRMMMMMMMIMMMIW